MLFRYQGKPQRLSRLFKLFRGMAPRLRDHCSNYGRAVVWASLLYAVVCAVVLHWADELSANLFKFFAISGAAFLLWGWAFSGVFQRYPCNRKTTGGRIMRAIGLLLVAFFGLVIITAVWLDLSSQLSTAHAKPPVAMWGLASLGVFLLSRWIVWLRLRDEMIQEYELDFLHKLLPPLLRDLPQDAACTLSCNPFTPMWSEKFAIESWGGRNFHIRDDVLLDFQAKLDPGATLTLQTFTRRVDKYKIRKGKYKGTKHRVAMVCRFQHPALARLDEAGLRQLSQVCDSLKGQRRHYVMAVRRDLKAGKVTVVGKGRFDHQRELGAGDLPSADSVLATLRALSTFTASLPSR